MRAFAISYISALIFGLGLGLAGMTQPRKIIAFLDIFGKWDPSLLFVMVTAIAVHGSFYFFIKKRSSPLFAPGFRLPNNKKIDKKMVLGSLLFGAGWGLGGLCPGPAIVAIFSGASSVLIFLASMSAGIYLYYIVIHLILINSLKKSSDKEAVPLKPGAKMLASNS